MAITQDFREFCEHMGIDPDSAVEKMKTELVGQIKFEELPVSVVLRDLRQMRKDGPSINAMIVEEIISNPTASYGEVATRFHICKMAIWRILNREGANKPWLKSLLRYKSSGMEGKGGVVGEEKGGRKKVMGPSIRG